MKTKLVLGRVILLLFCAVSRVVADNEQSRGNGFAAKFSPGLLKLRFQSGVSSDKIDKELSQTYGVITDPLRKYSIKDAAQAAHMDVVVTGRSSSRTAGVTWREVWVPTGEEERWLRILSYLPSVSNVVRVGFDSTRGAETNATTAVDVRDFAQGVPSLIAIPAGSGRIFADIEKLFTSYFSRDNELFFESPDTKNRYEKRRVYQVYHLKDRVIKKYWHSLVIDVCLTQAPDLGEVIDVSIDGYFVASLPPPPVEWYKNHLKPQYQQSIDEFTGRLSAYLDANIKVSERDTPSSK